MQGSTAAAIQGLPIQHRVGVTVQVAAQFTGISASKIYALLAAGDLEGKVIAGRRVVLVESLLRMVGQSPSTKRAAA